MIISIGETNPFKLTKDDCQDLLNAICATNSKVITANIDKSCPPIHACLRIDVPDINITNFKRHFNKFEELESAGGQT